MNRQDLMPVPHRVALQGVNAKFVIQSNFNDAVNVAQTFLHFKVGVALQAPRKGVDDVLPGQACAARAAHRQNEGKAKPGVVVSVQLLNVGELFSRAIGQARLALFACRFGSECLADHGLACQLGVSTNQGQLGFTSGCIQHLHHAVLQMRQGAKGALLQGGFGNPGGVLVQAVEQLRCFCWRCVVELLQGQCHGVLSRPQGRGMACRGASVSSGGQCPAAGKSTPGCGSAHNPEIFAVSACVRGAPAVGNACRC